jgi:putative methyltransferase (TIGR04325 family)
MQSSRDQASYQLTHGRPLERKTLFYRGSSLLAPLASVIQLYKKRLTVLDFGGGLGQGYLEVRRVLANPTDIEYHIIENEKTCEEGRALFSEDPHVIFYSQLPKFLSTFDLVYLGSSLHYIDDWKATLSQLISYQPEHILIHDLPAGDFKTFATGQNYYESVIPCWFFNLDEVIQTLLGLGYKLRDKRPSMDLRLIHESYRGQQLIPEEVNLECTWDLFFTRI